MDKKKKEKSNEAIEEVFKDTIFEIFSQKIPDVYRDEEGYIIAPISKRKGDEEN